MTKYKKSFGNAKVFYRILPFVNNKWEDVRLDCDGKTIQVKNKSIGRGRDSKFKAPILQFNTDGLFYNTLQSDIYSEVMSEVVENVLVGQNALVIGFGQTGSGKSLTLGGLQYSYCDRGIIPRTIENIFTIKENLPKNLKVTLEISYIEILPNNRAHDLLLPYPAPVDTKSLSKLTKIVVRDEYNTLQHLFKAEGRKEFAKAPTYPSNIGNCIFTFYVTTKNMNLNDPYRVVSHLHLVDLAGADIPGSITSSFRQSKAIGNANYAKSVLELFILLLMTDDVELVKVKERTNIFFQVLANCVSRKSILRCIGHLRTSKDDISLTISMLKFGHLIKGLQPEGNAIDYHKNEDVTFKVLKDELANLKKEKMLGDMILNQELIKGPVSQERVDQIQRLVEDYIKNKTDEIQLAELGDFSVVACLMKNIINTSEIEKADAVKEAYDQAIEVASLTRIKKSKSGEMSLTSSKIGKSFSKKISKGKEGKNGKKLTEETSKELLLEMSKTNLSNASDVKYGRKSKMTSLSKKVQQQQQHPKRRSIPEGSAVSDVGGSSLLSAVQQYLVPDEFPEYKEALKEYVVSDKSMYKSASEAFRSYEREAKELSKSYHAEIRKLNEMMALCDFRRIELMQATMIRDLTEKPSCIGETNPPAKMEFEDKCRNNLAAAQESVRIQQEIVLSLQADLKLMINMRQQIKNDVKTEFNEFCKEKFYVELPKLGDNPEIFDLDLSLPPLSKELQIEELSEEAVQEKTRTEMYEKLQLLIVKEAKEKALYLKNKIQWLKYTYFVDK